MMTDPDGLQYRHNVKQGLFNVFIGEPEQSSVCGILNKVEDDWWEWSVKLRQGNYDKGRCAYVPSLVRAGYAKGYIEGMRQMVQYIKEMEEYRG